jgi:hypothetical protein
MNEKARQALTKFLYAWQNKKYNNMYKYCQLTWKKNHKKTELKDMFGNTELLKFEIVQEHENDAAILRHDFEVNVKVRFKQKTGFVKKILESLNLSDIPANYVVDGVVKKVTIIPENAPYKPDENGIYGVNPISVMKIERHQSHT